MRGWSNKAEASGAGGGGGSASGSRSQVKCPPAAAVCTHRVGGDARVVVDGEHVRDLVVGQLLRVARVTQAAHVQARQDLRTSTRTAMWSASAADGGGGE